MIVDDSIEIRGLLRDLVSPLADRVVECVDGQDFLDQYDASSPDWTVMDVRMPRLDGLSAMRTLHALRPSARVLLMTEFPSLALVQAAQAAGALGCLAKEYLHRVPELLQSGFEGEIQPLPIS
jgi:CheY-like chemotaxis protein